MHFDFGLFRQLITSRMANIVRDKGGNVALTVAICMVPLLLAVGAGLDYTRAYNIQTRMQSDLDAALVAAIKEIDDYDEDAIVEKIKEWFDAQSEKQNATYDLTDIKVDKTGHTITASASGTVPTTVMTLADIKTVPVGVVSAIEGPATSYLEVYIVIDKSPSMLLAATSEDQAMLRADKNITCEFACHDTKDPVKKNGSVIASTYYNYIKNLGVKLRTDVALDAVEEVLDMIDAADEDHARIKVGLYSLGETINEVLAPTYSTSTARKKLSDDDAGLTSATSMTSTDFETSLEALQNKVGKADDGSSASKPLKLVLLLTDGVQSHRNWVINDIPKGTKCIKKNAAGTCIRHTSNAGKNWGIVTPLNPDWCGYLKNNEATVAVLYTEYLAIPEDWGYNDTLDDTMAKSRWTSTWGGTLHSGISSSTTRHDYIPIALQDCASSSDLFISAASEDEITAGLSTLFNQYLTSVRLTQ
ncbi:transmembrane protein (plasmid) [Sinorhizobium americanum CCGM7]|uniref:TadE/TadG family type IV pilus assembly protein n=1 Tax=Sinorhizobium americanum TaxID=194963 RepID=UPI0004D8B681|nr:TadE/TadG family type IV pilus assembly protein [Sinorhizobium americanum]APG88175.1 transmembrane protein [Sinorhizobium americanum CCGM7]